MIHLFIGYDPRQPIAFQVAAHSVWKHAKSPVAITRLDLSQLPIERRGLTEFTYSRFLVPYLSGFDGVSIFLDSDVLVRGDVAELLAYPLMYPDVPVFVVKGSRQFEWPSVMVFSNACCQRLTPSFVASDKNPLNLSWATSVGELPKDWNHLVGYDKPNPRAKLVHFTMGIPIWGQTRDCEFADEWWRTYSDMGSSVSFDELMGRSVHVQHMKAGA